MENILEKKVETDSKSVSNGLVDAAYRKVATAISKIPNRYVRDFVRGAATYPFLFSIIPEIIRKVPKIKRKLDLSVDDFYSFSEKMVNDRTEEIECGENYGKTLFDFCSILAGFYASFTAHMHSYSFLAEKVFHKPSGALLLAPFIIGSGLD